MSGRNAARRGLGFGRGILRGVGVVLGLAMCGPGDVSGQETPSTSATKTKTQTKTRVVAEPVVVSGSTFESVRREWTRFGIPLGRDADVRDLNRLALIDPRGATLPTAFRALSRWDGPAEQADRPLKWVLATTALPRRPARLRLVESARSVTINGALRTTVDDDGRLTIIDETSSLRIRLANGSRNLLDEIRVGDDVVTAASALGILAEDEDGNAIDAAPWRIVAPKASRLSDATGAVDVLAVTEVAGLEIELRLHLVSGAPEIVLDVRVVNRGLHGHDVDETGAHVYFRRLGLTLPTLPKAAVTTVAGTSSRRPGTALALLQHHEVRPGKTPAERFPFEVWQGRTRRHRGERADGVIVAATVKHVASIAVERFHQNAPKALTVTDSVAMLDLFPLGGHGPEFRGRYGTWTTGPLDRRATKAYRFEGARAKTTRVRLRFATHDDESDARRLFDHQRRTVDHPLHALPSAEHVARSGATGRAYAIPTSAPSRSVARFERLLRTLVDDGAADPQGNLGRIGLPAFIRRGGTYGGQVFHGWFNDGDLAWGDGYCSLHYDWPLLALLGYVRSGDARYFDLGRRMGSHRIDIDQDHDTTSKSPFRGGQFYEKGYWHGNYSLPTPSHTWLGGPLLLYVLTGDERGREAAELGRGFLERRDIRNWHGYYGSRIAGWTIDNLLDVWWYLGRAEDLEHAEAVIRRFEKLETEEFGAEGYVLNRATKPPTLAPWMHDIVFHAVARHAWLTGSKEFHPLLRRMRIRLKAWLAPGRDGGPTTTWRYWRPEGGKDPDIHLTWARAASFAWAARVFDDPADRKLARDLFEGCVQWFQGYHGRGSARSTVSFRLTQYPGSESKVMSNIGQWGLTTLPALEKSR